CGTATPRRPTPPTGWPRRCCWCRPQAYRQQYGFHAITLLPVNLYGPGDNFNLETSHVIPALIRKALEAHDAGRDVLEVWGTGSPTRGFLFVRDAARASALATESYDAFEPVNVGSGQEVSMRPGDVDLRAVHLPRRPALADRQARRPAA